MSDTVKREPTFDEQHEHGLDNRHLIWSQAVRYALLKKRCAMDLEVHKGEPITYSVGNLTAVIFTLRYPRTLQ